MKPGKLIAIEGIDGAGTTTQTRLLCERLQKRDIPVYASAEPSTGLVGQFIRTLLKGNPLPTNVMAPLFVADRNDHLATTIEPRLADGVNVVTDRYTLSTMAYQYDYQGNWDLFHGSPTVDDWFVGLLENARVPHATLYLNITLEEATSRIAKRNKTNEFYELPEYQERAWTNYCELAVKGRDKKLDLNQNISVIDGSGDEEQVADRLEAAALNLIWNS